MFPFVVGTAYNPPDITILTKLHKTSQLINSSIVKWNGGKVEIKSNLVG